MKWDSTSVTLVIMIVAIFLFIGLAAVRQEQRHDECTERGGVYIDGNCMRSEFFIYLDKERY